jgi:cobyrinic acid a,c-diamide synthase
MENIKINIPRILIAGISSGVGKTTISCALMLALQKKGLVVQPFKVGPDYIDPTYHTEITGRQSSNLDTYMLTKKVILAIFKNRANGADICIIEGVMGLYDGLNNTEIGSTAYLAKIIKTPVLLIINASCLSRSAGAIALGYKKFDRNVNIAGIILNNIGSQTHYENTKKSIEEKTQIPVCGFLLKEPSLTLKERHLGLIPTNETSMPKSLKNKMLNLMKNIDINKIIEISKKTESLSLNINQPYPFVQIKTNKKYSVKIAIAKDKAFNFYYIENIDMLKYFGAEIYYFSPIESENIPEFIDGLYIGGGFPELFARELSKNIQLKSLLYKKIEKGMPLYAECGGLMYLMEKIVDFEKKEFSMMGVFKGTVKMADKLNALGYVEIETIKNNILSKKGEINKGHVFHWSYLDNLEKNISYAYKISKSNGKHYHDGLIKYNVLAAYTHLHFATNIILAENFIKTCERYKTKKIYE